MSLLHIVIPLIMGAVAGAWINHTFWCHRAHQHGIEIGKALGWRECRNELFEQRQQQLRAIFDSLDQGLTTVARPSVYRIRPRTQVVKALVRPRHEGQARTVSSTLNAEVVS